MRMRLDISRASLNLCRGGFPEVFSNILPCGLGHLDGIDVREGCVVRPTGLVQWLSAVNGQNLDVEAGMARV